MLILLPLSSKAQKLWDHSSLWLEEGEMIDVKIPSGSRQVRVLFKHDNLSQRMETWQTSHIPDDANGSVYFRVPYDMQRSDIRFEWNGYDPLPFSFYLVKAISAHGHLIPQIGIIYSTVLKLRPSELLKTP